MLKAKSSEHDEIESVKLISDRDTGQSKDFGFIEMGSDADANAAIAVLNGADFDGRTLKVNEAKPKTEKTGGGRGGFGGSGKW